MCHRLADMMSFFRALAFLASATAQTQIAIPHKMRAMQASDTPCSGPDWSCLKLQSDVPVPTSGVDEVLIKMRGASVIPASVAFVDELCKFMPVTCSNGTIGVDGAGTVAAVGEHCEGLAAGDAVWGFPVGAYAEFAVAKCAQIGHMPKSLDFIHAATVPASGITGLEILQHAGAPWKPLSNVTVAITAGQGGTGLFGIQIARAFGAMHIVTAATGSGISMVKRLGATLVVDYHKQNLFDVLPANSIDVVYDNLGRPGTADKAMHALRKGGTYLLLNGLGGGSLAKHPKEGVTQIEFRGATPSRRSLDLLAGLFDSHALIPYMFEVFGLMEVPQAFNRFKAHGVIGKMAIATTEVLDARVTDVIV